MALITVWSTLPSTVAVRTSGKFSRARRKESMKVSVRSPSAGTTQPFFVSSLGGVAQRLLGLAGVLGGVLGGELVAGVRVPARLEARVEQRAGSWSPAMLSGRTRATVAAAGREGLAEAGQEGGLAAR